MQKFKKQPSEILDYDVDMSEWFNSIPNDQVSSVSIIISCETEEFPTLVQAGPPHPDYTLMGADPVRFKLWLAGGTDYAEYKVTCRVTTQQDRLKEVDFLVRMRDL